MRESPKGKGRCGRNRGLPTSFFPKMLCKVPPYTLPARSGNDSAACLCARQKVKQDRC